MPMTRDGTPPIEILRQLAGEDPEFAAASGLAPLLSLPEARPLGDLRRPQSADENELLRHRFLCRGGSLLFVGPTGAGKSSFTMQAAILWALGRPCFGLEPARPLRILIIQAENDEGDLAEMRDGVISGLGLAGEDIAAAAGRVVVVTEDSKTREAFTAALDGLLQFHQVDLVIIDPAFAYLGGEASAQRDVSPFLRNMLNPVIHRHGVGLILVHHVNKPPSGEQKPQWQAGDYAYLGSGSAEFANWARAVMAIRSIGSGEVFELLLAKRGRRVGWVDDMGRPTNSRYIAYHREPGVICWREAEPHEVAPFLPPEKAVTVQTVVDLIGAGLVEKSKVVAALKKEHGLAKTVAYRLIDYAIEVAAVRTTGPANRQTLVLTGKLKSRTPVEDVSNE